MKPSRKQVSRQNNNNTQYQRRHKTRADPNLELRASYKGQLLASIIVPQLPEVLSTTVTTGVVAFATPVSPPTQTSAWATRFQTLFEEYRVVKSVAEITLFSSISPGQLNCWFDEVDQSAPTGTEPEQRVCKRFAIGSNQSVHTVVWTPHDLADLNYSPVAAAVLPVTFKIFTDNANYGSSVVATQICTVTIKNTIQFRGFQL